MQREEESQMHFTESGEYKTPPYDNRVHYDVHFYAHISHFFPLSLSLSLCRVLAPLILSLKLTLLLLQ